MKSLIGMVEENLYGIKYITETKFVNDFESFNEEETMDS